VSVDSEQKPVRLPRLAVAAAAVAFLFAAIELISAFRQPFLLFAGIIPLIAGVGILRKHIWSAYGFALFELVQIAITPVLLLRSTVPKVEIAATAIVYLASGLLFILAGKSLAATGAKRGWVSPWIAVSCLFTLPFIFLQPFVIPSGGMEDTLMPGDRIMVRVFPQVYPAEEDLVVFRYPADRTQTYVKRVIGMPGDRIKIKNQIVYRNQSALHEPYVRHKTGTVDSYRDNFPSEPPTYTSDPLRDPLLHDMLKHHVENGEVVVPPRYYFVLGDNRDNSLDSRYWGFVDARDILGRPMFIYLPKLNSVTPLIALRQPS